DALAEGFERLLVLRARVLAAVLGGQLRLRLEAERDLLVRVHPHALRLARDGAVLDGRRGEVGADGDDGDDEAGDEAASAASAAAPGTDEHGGGEQVRGAAVLRRAPLAGSRERRTSNASGERGKRPALVERRYPVGIGAGRRAFGAKVPSPSLAPRCSSSRSARSPRATAPASNGCPSPASSSRSSS